MNIRELAQNTLGFDYNFEIQEIAFDGVYVKYDGKAATVGGNAPYALARGYMLLAKNIREGKASFEITQKPHFKDCGVMLDVSRGRVMTVDSVKKYLDTMALHGMNMVMLYTEDVYEVPGYPYMGYQRGRYTLEELRQIDDYANSLGIEAIPCIQTLGHMEKLLRYSAHKDMAENYKVLLPGAEKTYEFVEACISTIRKAFRTKRVHIGCDEAYGLGFGKTYAVGGTQDAFKLFNDHLHRVVDICRKYDFHPMMWSDMYFSIGAHNRSEDYGLEIEVPQELVDTMPDIDMVFWDYYHDNNEFYRVNIEKHLKFNRHVLFAGGIWTWNGFVPNYRWTYDTVKPAMEECLRYGIDFVLGCSWTNGGCEVSHFLATACLSLYSEYCWLGTDCTDADIFSVSEFITKMPHELTEAISDFFIGLPGDYCVGQMVTWSDPLVNLLCFGYDLPKAEKMYTAAMEVFEKYPDAPDMAYYKAVFRCALHKAKLHQDLIPHYKAGDKAWLKSFAEETLPEMAADFEALFELFDSLWHRDYKTQGFEHTAMRYAAAIDRLRYTAKTIKRYLNGETEKIEALEPELIHGTMQKFTGRDAVMTTFW